VEKYTMVIDCQIQYWKEINSPEIDLLVYYNPNQKLQRLDAVFLKYIQKSKWPLILKTLSNLITSESTRCGDVVEGSIRMWILILSLLLSPRTVCSCYCLSESWVGDNVME
jgi:hypothetical protein